MRRVAVPSLILLIMSAACTEETLPFPDGGSDSGSGECLYPIDCAAPPPECHYEGGDFCTSCGTLVCDADASIGAEPDAGALTCGARPFPAIPRSCSASSDCTVVEHQINCCGSLAALGIRAEARAEFEAAEGPCRDSYPLCGCASQPTLADDGTIDQGGQTAGVDCIANLCTSTFAPAAPRACTPGGSDCGPGYSCCYPCGIEGCEFQCEPSCAPGTPACVGGCLLRP